jgi:crossover junction endodeoxyribonuclease RuvC
MICGIDPGAGGAIAFLTEDGLIADVLDMPTVNVNGKNRVATQALALLIAANRPTHAYVELVAARPGQGVSSMFAFGQACGVVDGVLAALGVPVTYITPQQWKRAMQVTKDKGSSRRRAMQLFPARAALFQRVQDDGRAEAVLLGAYALRAPVAEPCVRRAKARPKIAADAAPDFGGAR